MSNLDDTARFAPELAGDRFQVRGRYRRDRLGRRPLAVRFGRPERVDGVGRERRMVGGHRVAAGASAAAKDDNNAAYQEPSVPEAEATFVPGTVTVAEGFAGSRTV